MEKKEEPLDRPISLMMSKSEVAKIDDIRFETRAASRGEVIRSLVRSGINAAAPT